MVRKARDRAQWVRRCTARRIRCAPGLLVLVCGGDRVFGGDFADQVIEFLPAPGQFINNASFNDPSMALGAPIGGGTSAPANGKVVSLGGFGGSITLGFALTVLDDPCNPFGLDAIVFGNAFFKGGDLLQRWGEGGIVEISRDMNGNGIADDQWFVIAGPALASVPLDGFEVQQWDNDAGTALPPMNLGWYPSAVFYPGICLSYETGTIRLPIALEVAVIVNPNGTGAMMEGWWGLSDMTPPLLLGDLDGDDVVDDGSLMPGEFYTRADNPFAVGITIGSGGGDAFDIAWAVDAATGEAARLDGFDFVRISTGANADLGFFGEISTEVSGVSDARSDEGFFDRTGDGVANVEDLYQWHKMRQASDVAADLNGDFVLSELDRLMMMRCVRRGEAEGVVAR